MFFSNIFFLVPLVLVIRKKLYALAVVVFLSGATSNLYHFAYLKEHTISYITGNLTTIEMAISQGYDLSDLIVWILPDETKLAFLVLDYAFSNLLFIAFLVYMTPKKSTTEFTNPLIILLWIGWFITTTLIGTFDTPIDITPSNSNHASIAACSAGFIIGFFFFLIYRAERPDVKESVLGSLWRYYKENYNLIFLGLCFVALAFGLVFWLFVQDLYLNSYFIAHGSWHLCENVAQVFFALSVLDDSTTAVTTVVPTLGRMQ